MRCTLALVILLMGTMEALGQVRPPRGQTVPPPAEGAYRITALLDRETYLLGENIPLRFRVENTGDVPFEVESGGDYRGAARALRFTITATRADGLAAADPYPSGNHMGGLVSAETVGLGESWERAVPLGRYIHFPEPGEYILRVRHDLGWGVDVAPAAEVRVRLRMPQPQEAEKLVDAMLAAGEEQRDLSVLRYPIYLSRLRELAAQAGGDRKKIADEAMQALAMMPDPQAVETLLEMAEEMDPAAATRIARAINTHLSRHQARTAGRENPLPLGDSWRAAHAPAVRGLALELLLSDRDEPIRAAAAALLGVGQAGDLPALTKALDGLIERAVDAQPIHHIFKSPRDSIMPVRRAIEVVIERGGALPAEPRTPAEITLHLWVNGPAGKISAAALVEWSAHPMPYVRETVLSVVPQPAPDELLNRLPALIEDEEVTVRLAACRLAERDGTERHLPALLRRLEQVDNHWELGTCYAAAVRRGGQVEAWRVIVEKLAEPKLAQAQFDTLADVFKDRGGGSGWHGLPTPEQVAHSRRAWTDFLDRHEAALRAGERFAVNDPRLPLNLFPPQCHYNTATGAWPPGER